MKVRQYMKCHVYQSNKGAVNKDGKPAKAVWKLSAGSEGRRLVIHLGVQTKKSAEGFERHANEVLAAKVGNRRIEAETEKWLSELFGNNPPLYEKLVDAGWIDERDRRTLGQHVEKYKKAKKWKKNTVDAFYQAEKYMIEYFGFDCPLYKISADRAKSFRGYLVNERGLGKTTVSKYITQAKSVFADAVDRDLISKNPFAKVETGKQVNEKRRHYITHKEFLLLLDECADARQRLILTLHRYAGLRPHELELLRWDEVNWKLGIFTVRTTKTEDDGNSARTIKMFPVVASTFWEYLETLPEGTKDDGLVFPELIPYDRLFITKIAKRCGLGHIEKIPTNCRSSIGTQLLDEGWKPSRVAQFLGNSVPVLLRHYYQIRHYQYGDEIQKESQNDTEPSAETWTGAGQAAEGKKEVAEQVAERDKTALNHVESAENEILENGNKNVVIPYNSTRCSENTPSIHPRSTVEELIEELRIRIEPRQLADQRFHCVHRISRSKTAPN